MFKELPFGAWHVVAAPRTPQRRLNPVGACIYCGSVEALTDEHILPDGIGGDLILPAASCKPCQDKIKPWETRVQKRNLGATRAASGVRSRKRRGRNKGEEKRLYRAVAKAVGDRPIDEDRGPEMDASELPRMVLLETTKGRPELLGGPLPENGLCVVVAARADVGPTEYTIDFHAYGGDVMRLIAKIAHGFAVASVGVDAFEPFLTDIILADKHDPEEFWKHIGSLPIRTHTDIIHRVRVVKMTAPIRSKSGLGIFLTPVIVAHVQLFANCSGPIYEVVVGRKKPEPKLPFQ